MFNCNAERRQRKNKVPSMLQEMTNVSTLKMGKYKKRIHLLSFLPHYNFFFNQKFLFIFSITSLVASDLEIIW